MTALTRGPKPARVYWRRRLLLLLLLLGLVAGTVRLAGLFGSDAPQERSQATNVGGEPATSEGPEVTAPDIPSESRGSEPPRRAEKKHKRDRGPVLAEPDGVCSDRDVAVTPSVRKPVAGSPVTFTLELRTVTTPACTWQVSPATMTMKITSGADDIWTSQDCPRAISSEEVVVRNNVGTEVEVTWSGRRSDDECSRLTEWALPGWYYVDAAALAGEPSNLHFELEKPDPEVIRKSEDSESQKKRKREQRRDGRDGRDGAERRQDQDRDRRRGGG